MALWTDRDQNNHPCRGDPTKTEHPRRSDTTETKHPRRGAITETDHPRRGFEPLRTSESKISQPAQGRIREKEDLHPVPSQGGIPTLNYMTFEPNKDTLNTH